MGIHLALWIVYVLYVYYWQADMTRLLMGCLGFGSLEQSGERRLPNHRWFDFTLPLGLFDPRLPLRSEMSLYILREMDVAYGRMTCRSLSYWSGTSRWEGEAVGRLVDQD